MAFVRSATERLLLLVFRLAQVAFLTQGVAVGAGLLATSALRSQDTPPWLESAIRSSMLVGGVLFVAGLLLVSAQRVPPSREEDDAGWTGARRALLGLSLVALSALAAIGASDLGPLWREITKLLEDTGFWREIGKPSQFSGVVMLPILVALFVPLLETTAACFLIVVPALLLILLLTRSRLLPAIFAMSVVCQAGLVLAGLLASDAFSQIATEAIAAMTTADDVEVHQAATLLREADDVLSKSAKAFVAPLVGFLVWLPLLLRPLLRSRSKGVDTEVASSQSPGAARPQPPPLPLERAGTRRAGFALAMLGAFMLAFGAMELLRPRARYVSSEPAPGATLSAAPATARVAFTRALDPSSSLSVTRMATRQNAGAETTTVTRSGELASRDSERRTLTAALAGIPEGLYHVAWSAVPASGGGVVGHGSFYFGVGTNVPDTVTNGGLLAERDSGARGRRQTFVGGALLLVLGIVQSRRRRG
jgi:methionine-rich copper-binding protein CopC